MFEHFIHEAIRTRNNGIILIDVCNTPDCGWEGAYSILDEEAFLDWWGEDNPYTKEDIMDYGEEAGAFFNWHVVTSHNRTPENAEKKLRKYITTM
jgi:hypothetical protein